LIKFVFILFYLFQHPGSNPDAGLIYNNFISAWLGVPASVQTLITRPWTLITYMFLHFEFLHIFFNMLWLYWFGKIFLEFLPDRQLYMVYFLGGISGALAFILAFNFFPAFSNAINFSVAIGASASVMAIVVAIAFMVPDYTIGLLFVGNVKIKYIALIFIAIDIAMIRSDNAGGHFAHIGGALLGMIFTFSYKKGYNFLYGLNLIRKIRKGRKSKFRKVYVSERPVSDEEYNANRAKSQAKLDGILDKIAKSGYSSLTKEEKEFLFKTSNK
jgi:membrane associated rhomboid family serine protease